LVFTDLMEGTMITTHRFLLILFTAACAWLPVFAQGTWEPITPPLYGGRPSEIVRDHDGRLWASYGAYVWRSTDDGRTWEERSPNVTDGFFTAVFYRIAAIKGPGGLNLIALYPAIGQSNTIYISPTNGLTWQEVQMPEAFEGAQLYVLGLSSGPALGFVENEEGAACLSSTDGGTTWSLETNFGRAPEQAVESADGFVYCYDENTDAIRRRAPDGTWTALDAPAPQSMVALVAGGTRILALMRQGCFVSTDAGLTWQAVTLPSGFDEYAKSSAAGYADGSFTLVTEDDDSWNSERIVRTFHLGSTETSATLVADSIRWELSNPVTLAPSTFIAVDNEGPVGTTDGGRTFERRVSGLTLGYIWRYAIGGSTVIATSVSGELYRSRINGTDWERITPVPRSRGDLPISDVVYSWGRFVGITRSGVIRSTDEGVSWTIIPNSDSLSGAFLTVRSNGDLLVPYERSILVSADHGSRWTPLYDGGADGPDVTHVAVAANGTVLFTSGRRLYRLEGAVAVAIDSADRSAFFPVTSPIDPLVFGYVSGNDEPGPRTINITRDGGATWSRGSYISVGGSDNVVLDAAMTNEGVMFTSNIDGMASMRPTDTEVTFAPTNDYRFPVALHADGNALQRSTASYIEKNNAPVSVDDEPGAASTVIATPNPVRDVLTVRGASMTDERVEIVDLLGVVQRSAPLVSGTASVSVDGLAPGWYLVRTDSFTQTIIVQR
jgi:photosystem II stability/assembly factor-like uncharacterized protein